MQSRLFTNHTSYIFANHATGLTIVLGTILLLLAIWWLYSIMKKRKIIHQKVKNLERNGGLLLEQQMSFDDSITERMKVFTSDELDRATDHFNRDRILGEGGHGTVYKGMLSEGRLVAIKRSKLMEESQLKQFINEMVILSRINHRNIVRLIGCCLETEVPLLVYEYISNGTLYDHIHHPSEEFYVTWKMRLQIAYDLAGALDYLHTMSSIPILHRDIKSSNILLDEKYKAKLSDFGTSRLVAIDQTHITTLVMGTFGYLDPEYVQSSQLTQKSDVYSFGVVLLELLTRQKAIRTTNEDRSLIYWFQSHMENSRLLDIIDPQILHEGSTKEFLTIANLAVQCLNLDGKKRPTMKEVQRSIEMVKSLHLPQTNDQNRPESQQMWVETAKNGGVSSSSSSSSAEMCLLFNPR